MNLTAEMAIYTVYRVVRRNEHIMTFVHSKLHCNHYTTDKRNVGLASQIGESGVRDYTRNMM